MSVELITVLLLGSTFLLLILGVPVAFALGAVGTVFAIALWGTNHLPILASAAFSSILDENLIAIPMFVFMGWIFERTGIADDMFESIHMWLGGVPGGLGIGTVLVAAIIAAMYGGVDAATFMLAATALPAMVKRGYDKKLAAGIVAASALLGLIIPPSILVIIYSVQTSESIGRLYLACMIPGIMIAALYMLYIFVRCRLNPNLGPPVPPEARMNLMGKIVSLRSVILPLLLVFTVLGSIYSGAVSPLEASAVGAAGAILIALVYRRITWSNLKQALQKTVLVCGLIIWLFMGIGVFTSVYQGVGAPQLATKIAGAIPGAGWGTVILTQFVLLLGGMLMDDLAVIMIFAPIFVPAIKFLGFDGVWYGALFMVNMNLAFMTPPYGWSVILMRVAIPKEYSLPIVDIYRAVLPFIAIQLFVLVLMMIFPQIVTFLPDFIIRPG